MRICTSREMRDLDSSAENDYLIEADILMENAGRAAVQQLFEFFPEAGRGSEILIFAGKGNNAGDAFVVARRLICLDRRVRIFHLVEAGQYQGATKKNFEILQHMKAKMSQLENVTDLEAFFARSKGPYVAVDGILGTGLKGELGGLFYDVVDMINKNVSQVVALDIPSGVNGDSGAIHGTSIRADLTISFGFPKLGHFLPPGAARRGELVNVDISLPPRFRKEGDKFLLRKNPLRSLLKERDQYGHKNSFGHALHVGGRIGQLGAISMSAQSCLKMGTGLVTIATWEKGLEPLLMRIPDEVMAIPLVTEGPEMEHYRKKLEEYTSLVIGPGLGTTPEARKLIEDYSTSYHGPLVVDADAINVIAENNLQEILLKRQGPTVITPHIGEMARLLGKDKKEVLADPLQAVRDAVEITSAVVVMKGAATIVGSTEKQLYLNHYPNDGMATAGSGDVLAGMIGGLIGQGIDPFQAALLGVYLHSLAGDMAGQKLGHRSMTAGDIIENIGNAFKDIETTQEPSFPEEGRARLL